MAEDSVEVAWPGHLPDPQWVQVRADQMLAVARQGLANLDDPELNVPRIVLGFYGVVVFGRAVTSALQNLRTFGEEEFNAWYVPWQADMRGDPLCQFFYRLRTDLLKDITPTPGVVVASASVEGATGPVSFTYDPTMGGGFAGYPDAVRRGSVSLGRDYPIPKQHRGQSIADPDLRNLATMYVQYLAEMVDSARPIIASVQARWRAEHPWQTPQSG